MTIPIAAAAEYTIIHTSCVHMHLLGALRSGVQEKVELPIPNRPRCCSPKELQREPELTWRTISGQLAAPTARQIIRCVWR